jgi:catechol 2,3-dioxygenase-like lactoylglutathione lyase family enzyme
MSAAAASVRTRTRDIIFPGYHVPRKELSMIDHTGLDVSDPEKSRRFYEQALAPLGYRVLMEVPTEFTGGAVVLGFGVPPKPDFWIHQGNPQTPRVHVAFRAESREIVDAFYQAAIAAGGKDNGPPGPRPHYHQDYYGGFVLDPDGHNIEACCHSPG